MKTIAILHTTATTVEPLKALAAEIVPECKVINFVDDSVLPQLASCDCSMAEVEERLVAYAQIAEGVGADVILNACSSVGECVSWMRETVDVPVVRIDEAMAEQAVSRAACIGVAATLPTTLGPTQRLLEREAARQSKALRLETALFDAAYTCLVAGDQAGHDQILLEGLTRLAGGVDVVVLAQASMARVLPLLPEAVRSKVVTSPRLAMQQVRLALDLN